MVGTIISGLSCSRGSWLMHLWIYAGMWALTNLPPRLADRLAAWTTVRASGRRLAQMPTHKKEGEAALAMVAHSRVFFVIAPFRVTNWFRSQLREWARDITTLLPLVITIGVTYTQIALGERELFTNRPLHGQLKVAQNATQICSGSFIRPFRYSQVAPNDWLV